MIDFIKKTDFPRYLFLNTFLFLNFLQGFEKDDKNPQNSEQPNPQNSEISYQIIDVSTIFPKLVFQNGFGINAAGNVIFADNKKMFPDDGDDINDGDDTSVQNFPDYKIPKIYFKNMSLNHLEKLATEYLSIKIPLITPVISKNIKDVMGGCKNSMCVLSADRLEKKHIQGIGGNAQEAIGLAVVYSPSSKQKIINADTITAIGGVGKYAMGIDIEGDVNANTLVAIGGSGGFASGFLNRYSLSIGNIIAIGGGGIGASGLENNSYYISEVELKSNSITAIGGAKAYAYGIYNAGNMQTNLLSAIGGKDVNAVGVYNGKKIQADVIIALAQNSGAAIQNQSKAVINVKSLVAIGSGGYHAVVNEGMINAENIHLRGKNAINNHSKDSITTNALFIDDFSSIQGGITLRPNSLLSFNINSTSWDGSGAFFEIKDANFKLNADTKIQAKFSNEWILENNLSYNQAYYLLTISGEGELVDKRADKNIEFLGLPITPFVNIEKQGIVFSFHKQTTENPANPANPETPATPATPETIAQVLQSISPQSPLIFHSMIESNQNGNKFQEVILNEGLQNFASKPDLLISLVKKTDEMFKNASFNPSNLSQKTTQYISQKITDRINTITFERKFRTPTFAELIRKWALASSDEEIYMPKSSMKNSAWLNIGGAYYQSPLAAFSSTSVNSSIGYDREIDMIEDVDFILGGLFNYAKSFYYQGGEREDFDIFTMGIYSNAIINQHEIYSNISVSELLGNTKIHKEEIGISKENYANNNFALNIEGFYKYRFTFAQKHSIKPLALANYSFLYTPASASKTFVLQKSYDQVFALGAGGEYHFENSFMKHNFQLTGRYHIADITKSRAIAFRGAQTFVNYDINPSRMWMKLSYGAKFLLPAYFDLDISMSADMSTSGDFLGMGNLGVSYAW